MEPTRLIVIRHGNTFNRGDIILRVGSATDLPLTETGIAQGHAAGKKLHELGLEPAAIFYAPLQRTEITAKMIALEFASGIPMQPADFLKELDYGPDDGQPENEVILRLGAVAVGRISRDTTIEELKNSGKTVLKRWDEETLLPEGWHFLASRVNSLPGQWQEFANKIQREYSGKTVVAVTSNGIARFSCGLLGNGEKISGSLKLSTGALGIYELSDGQWHCRQWNIRPELN